MTKTFLNMNILTTLFKANNSNNTKIQWWIKIQILFKKKKKNKVPSIIQQSFLNIVTTQKILNNSLTLKI